MPIFAPAHARRALRTILVRIAYLKVGTLADVPTVPGTTTKNPLPELAVWDRDPTGRQASAHAASGVSKWVPPGDPTLGYGDFSPDQYGVLYISQPRIDGFTVRTTSFKGRAYSTTA